jgi:hypothetical protein
MKPTVEQEPFTVAGLERQGLLGFVTVRDLRSSKLDEVPKSPGVYAILRPLASTPAFLSKSAGGWFKGKDPTVAVAVLKARWLSGAELIYVGKATAGSKGRTHLCYRLTKLLAYGSGKPVGHQGGRYLWQVEGSNYFVVAWRVVDAPTTEENQLLSDFFAAYGAYPFANIAGPRA